MKKPMLLQLLAAFLAIILVCIFSMFAITYLRMRSTWISNKTQALKSQARDVAYLASSLRGSDYYFGNIMQDSVTRDYLYQKTNTIYEEYNAFTLIVTSQGKSYSYYYEEALQDESLKYIPDEDTLRTYLRRAVQGEEIAVQTDSRMGPLFTVIIPWNESASLAEGQKVVGLVLIQTAAQNITGSFETLWPQLLLAGLIVFCAAALTASVLTRRLTRPLTAMARGAEQLSAGNFQIRVTPEGSLETHELAKTFNQMASQLGQLEQTRREFLANVSHELKSPITSIHGFAQGMLDGAVPPGEQDRYLRVIVDETERMTKLIQSLLSLSRMESGEAALNPSVFDLHELVRTVIISKMAQIDEKHLQVLPLWEDEPCYVTADQEQIQQVILNLLDNAVKYTPSHGEIRFATEKEGSIVRLSVRDSGEGIPPEEQEHIFDRFYKADKARTAGKGTGLGLAICKAIMLKHGQQIRLVPTETGCLFEITLQKGEPPHADKSPRENQLGPVPDRQA